MNLSRSALLATIALCSLSAARAAEVDITNAPPPKSESRPITLATTESADAVMLQGKWEGVEIGKEAQGKCTLTITGTTMHFEGVQKGEWYKAMFTLPPKTDPKRLQGRITDCPRPDMVGLNSPAIYKLDQGKLTLAGHKPGSAEFPKSFEPAPGARVFELKKVQAAEK